MAIATLGFKVDSSGVRRATKDLGALDARSKATEFAIAKLKKGIAAVGVTMAATFAAAAVINGIANFDREMSKVAAITQATSIELGAMRDVARELGATTEFSAKQAAEGLSFLGMAGFEAAESIAALPAVLDLATAAGLGLGSAADITSNIMSAFSIAARDSADVTDILAAASSSANTDVSQLGQAMKFVGPVAAGLGISMSDTAAAIGKLSDAGIQGGQAGTSLRKIMLSLAAPTKEATDTLTAMGISLSEVDPNVVSLTDIIDRLNEAQIDAAQGSKIFGQEAVSGILALTAQADGLRELTGELKNVDGAAGDMANTMRDNLGGDIDTLMSSVSGLILTMGDAGLTAVLRGVVAGLTGVINGVSGLINIASQLGGAFDLIFNRTSIQDSAMASLAVAFDNTTLAIGDQVNASNHLRDTLANGHSMTIEVIRGELEKAKARREDIKAMQEQAVELAKQSPMYQGIISDIQDARDALRTQRSGSDGFEESELRIVDALNAQKEYLETVREGSIANEETAAIIDQIESNIAALEGKQRDYNGAAAYSVELSSRLDAVTGSMGMSKIIADAEILAEKLGTSFNIALALARIGGSGGASGPDQANEQSRNRNNGGLDGIVSSMSLGPSTISGGSGGGSRRSGGGGGGGQSAAQKQRDNDLRDAEKILDGLKTTQDEYNDAVSEANRLYEAGVLPMAAWDAQLTSLEAGMADSKFGELRDDVDGFTASLFDGIDGIKSFAQTMIQEFAMLQASNAIKGFLGIGGGGATTGIIGSFLTGAFADGTNNAPGGPALVGERGPEIVNLKKGDTVTPNHALGGAMDVRVSVDNNGNLMAFVRDQAGKLISQSTPAIVSQSVSASARASQSTKSLFINAS